MNGGEDKGIKGEAAESEDGERMGISDSDK